VAGVNENSAGGRFPDWVYRVGAEPDPRFSLANERTFLAWIRTSLALIAGGVALEALALPLEPRLRLAAAVLLLVLGLVVPVVAWVDWARIERAMRAGGALPSPWFTLPLTVGLVVVGVLILVGLLVR
jgi:putative membrane protein